MISLVSAFRMFNTYDVEKHTMAKTQRFLQSLGDVTAPFVSLDYSNCRGIQLTWDSHDNYELQVRINKEITFFLARLDDCTIEEEGVVVNSDKIIKYIERYFS